MKLFKIKIFNENNYYFHTEEIYCENLDKCKELFIKKYPGYIFEIEEEVI